MRKKASLTIEIYDLQYFLMGVIVCASCIQVPYLTAVYKYVSFYRLIQIGIVFLGVYLSFSKYSSGGFLESKTNRYVLLYFLIYIVSCVVNRNTLNVIIQMMLRVIAFALLIDLSKNGHFMNVVAGSMFMLVLITGANTLSSILYPNALYANNAGRYVCFLLGEDNASINIYLLAVCVSAVYTYLCRKKMTGWLLLTVINILHFSLSRNIGGGIICSATLVVLYLAYLIVNIKLKLSHVMLFMIVFFFLFIILQELSIFANLIINYLHRDLTLSSRTTLWKQAIALFKDKPLLGYGSYYSSALANTLYGGRFIWTVITPHNTYLANLIAGGVSLFAMFFFCMFHMTKSFDRQMFVVVDHEILRTVIAIAWVAILLHAQIEGSDTECILIGYLFTNGAIENTLKIMDDNQNVNEIADSMKGMSEEQA